jgi:hypothetical protein
MFGQAEIPTAAPIILLWELRRKFQKRERLPSLPEWVLDRWRTASVQNHEAPGSSLTSRPLIKGLLF